MTPADVLREAADLIEERGWWNGRPQCGVGGHCPLSAFSAIARSSELERRAKNALLEALDWQPIANWNDRQPNGDVVIAKLREVADNLERAS